MAAPIAYRKRRWATIAVTAACVMSTHAAPSHRIVAQDPDFEQDLLDDAERGAWQPIDDVDDALPKHLASSRPQDTADREMRWRDATSHLQRRDSDEHQSILPPSAPHIPHSTRTPTYTDPARIAQQLTQPTAYAHAVPAAASLVARDWNSSTATVTRVPAGFQSSLVSTWTPRDRSPWFQRKAIIITSIFLAIFIVLTIGAAVFLRDRKLDDLIDDDDDDEAAIERMVQERLKAGMKDKEKKLRRKSAGGDDGAGGNGATGIKGVVGRMRLRRRRKGAEGDATVAEKQVDDVDTPPRQSLDAISTRSVRSSDQDDSAGSPHRSDRRTRTAMRWVRVAVPVSPSSRRPGTSRTPSIRSLVDISNRQSPPPPISGAASTHEGDDSPAESSPRTRTSEPARVPLDASDFGAADAAEARGDASAAAAVLAGAVPPAYQNRTPRAGPSARRPSEDDGDAPPPPHPQHALLGVRRPLAGEEEEARSGALDSASEEKSVLARREEEQARTAMHETAHGEALGGPAESAVAGPAHAPAHALEAHVATDDKTVLSALAAARGAPPSAPLGAGDETVPLYAEREGDEVPSVPSSSSPASAHAHASAPPVLLDHDGFELLDSEPAHATSTRSSRPSTGSSARTTSEDESDAPSALPPPPAPHVLESQALLARAPTSAPRGPGRPDAPRTSRFDEPYALRAEPGVDDGRRADEQRRAARRAEKAAEAAQEREVLPSAPGVLPAYEQREEAGSASGAPSAPSAPPLEEGGVEEVQEQREGELGEEEQRHREVEGTI